MTASPRAAALTVTAFASVEALYLVNVRALPGEHFLSLRSLVSDAIALLPVAVAAVAILRTRSVRHLRRRWERPMAWVGGTSLAAAAAVLVGSGPWATADTRPAPAGDGPNLLLVVLDSARRDHIGAYGYPRPSSPALDAMAAGARVYDAAYAAAPWTVPSVSELMTGRLDGASARPTLAESLAARGYATACFTDNPHLDSGSPLLRGFGIVERSVGSWRHALRGTVVGETMERVLPGDDRALVHRVLAFARRTSGPVFIYVHLMDSHAPYRWPALDKRRRSGRRIEFPVTGMSMTADEGADVIARYDGGVRSASDQAARLVADASTWGGRTSPS